MITNSKKTEQAEKPVGILNSRVNWNQVYYFSEVASCGSIKDAAAKLGVTSPTLSEQVAQLEKSLGVLLFFRQHRKLSLTPEGTRLYLRAKEMFEAGQRLIGVIAPVPLGTYPVSIGLIPSPSIQLAYKAIGDYLDVHGPLNMKLVHAKYEELEIGLSKGQFDFGFSDRISERKDLVHHLISSSVTRFYVAQKWANARFSELLEWLPLLVCNAEPASKSFAERALSEAGYPATAVITSDYPSVLVDLCQRGLGIGVFSEGPMKQENLDSLRSFRVPKDAPKLEDKLFVLWTRDGENTEVIKRLRELLSE